MLTCKYCGQPILEDTGNSHNLGWKHFSGDNDASVLNLSFKKGCLDRAEPDPLALIVMEHTDDY